MSMRTYSIDMQKIKPFEKRGKKSYTRGVVARRMIVSESVDDKPELITDKYIDYLIKKHKMKRAMIDKYIDRYLLDL